MEVKDEIEVSVPLNTAFNFFTDNISKWWTANAQIEKKKNGKIVLHWINGSKLESSFAEYNENQEMEFEFGKEILKIFFKETENGTAVSILHSQIEDIAALIHVAQTWRFLLYNFKLVLEKGIDLRHE